MTQLTGNFLLNMTERITTGFSLPATNPNPEKKNKQL